MKIAIICNSLSWGGLELFMGKIARWAQLEGHESLVFGPPQSKIAAFAQEHQLRHIPFATRWKYADLAAMYQLSKQLKANRIETCLIGHSKDIGLLALTKKIFGLTCKLVYPQQMQIGKDKRDLMHTFFYNALDSWVTPLNWLRDNTLQRTRIRPEKVRVIPFGIDHQLFAQYTLRQQEARKKLDLPETGLLIGIIGRFHSDKGQETLIRAMALLKNRGLDARLVMVGEVSQGDTRDFLGQYQRLIESLGLGDRVFIRPFQKQVQIAFKALDIFVTASVNETYGYVTIEAMASGLAVVGAKAAGTAHLIRHGQNGLLFENRNPEALAQALAELIEDPVKRQELGQRAQQEAQQVYDYRQQIQLMFG